MCSQTFSLRWLPCLSLCQSLLNRKRATASVFMPLNKVTAANPCASYHSVKLGAFSGCAGPHLGHIRLWWSCCVPARTAPWLCVRVGINVCPSSRSECVQETKGFRLSHHLLRQLTPLSVPRFWASSVSSHVGGVDGVIEVLIAQSATFEPLMLLRHALHFLSWCCKQIITKLKKAFVSLLLYLTSAV